MVFSKLQIRSVPDLSTLRAEYGDSDDEVASIAPTEVSQDEDSSRVPLQWEFHGLTLWLELEEFDGDLTNAIQAASKSYGIEPIPRSHATAIYGMTHLSVEQAKEKLHELPTVLSEWPVFDRPVGVKQDVAQVGRPGQVCNIAWAELTLSSNEQHESAMDALFELFEMGKRTDPFTPHHSIAYDNPKDSVLSLADTIAYAARHPTLLTRRRRVTAISLWNTEGKMADWEFLDRVRFR